MQEPSHSPVIATYAVLSGLALFVPVPFVDDILRTRLLRHMVRTLGDRRGMILSDDTVETLADDPPGAPLHHRLAIAAVVYPVKKIFQKTFMVLAGKQAVDTVSATYHLGWLVDSALAERWHEQRDAAAIRAAVDKACKEVGTKPVEGAIGAAWTGSKDLFKRIVKRGEAKPEQEEVQGLAARIRAAVAGVPRSHFDRLRETARRELGLSEAP